MADTTDIKNGLCIHFKEGLYSIVSFQHVKPGKGPAFVRTKLKNVITGKVIDNTFNSGVKIEVARIERRPFQFLYKDDLGYNLMHTETYDQMVIEEKLIAAHRFLKDGDNVDMLVHADTETPLYVELPQNVVLQVTYTEPGLKGDTASSTALKQATVETGAIVMVPLFINQDDKIKIDTKNGTYVERVKA
jgi:elongation factor P